LSSRCTTTINPPPHFHARYGDVKAIIDIESLTVLYGELTPRVLGLVVEWAAVHKAELLPTGSLPGSRSRSFP